MLKKIRIVLAVLLWLGITALLLDFTGVLHGWLGWMAKIQFLPAVLALNLGIILGLVILTLVGGRLYCSIICPLGVFQDGVAHLFHKRPYRFKKELKWLRYGVLGLFILAIILGINSLVALLAPYSAWGRIVQNLFQPVYLWFNNIFAAMAERAGSYAFYNKEIWLRSLPTFIIAIATLIVIVVMACRGGRDYCNTVCPVGTTLGLISRFAMFRPVIDTEKCKNCRKCARKCKASCLDAVNHSIDYCRCVNCFNCIDSCEFDALNYQFAWGKKKEAEAGSKADKGRRAFLTGTAIAIGSAAAKAQEKKVDGGLAAVLDKKVPKRETAITPPGSNGHKNMYSHCTGCQLCVAQCPNNVLRPSTDLEHLMQPESSYERGWCRPECTRCSQVCPTGAIRPFSKEEKSTIKIGTATIRRDLCLAENGESCGNCARRCPSGAIQMVKDEARDIFIPSVDKERCIGCGACEFLCPTRPISAIFVEGLSEHRNV